MDVTNLPPYVFGPCSEKKASELAAAGRSVDRRAAVRSPLSPFNPSLHGS